MFCSSICVHMQAWCYMRKKVKITGRSQSIIVQHNISTSALLNGVLAFTTASLRVVWHLTPHLKVNTTIPLGNYVYASITNNPFHNKICRREKGQWFLVPSHQPNSCPHNKICKREKEGHQIHSLQVTPPNSLPQKTSEKKTQGQSDHL
jgi:hypothetical protein